MIKTDIVEPTLQSQYVPQKRFAHAFTNCIGPRERRANHIPVSCGNSMGPQGRLLNIDLPPYLVLHDWGGQGSVNANSMVLLFSELPTAPNCRGSLERSPQSL